MNTGKTHQFYNLGVFVKNCGNRLSNNGTSTISRIGPYLIILWLSLSTAGCIAYGGTIPKVPDAPPTNSTSGIQENICYGLNLSDIDSLGKYPVGYPDQLKKYWIHIDPISDHNIGDVFQITGCAVVPERTYFSGGITQNEHFTPLGSPFIESTVKNISTTFATSDSSVQLFSYEVNSTDFVYSIYRVDIGAIDLYTNEALVDDWRLFNITHTV